MGIYATKPIVEFRKIIPDGISPDRNQRTLTEFKNVGPNSPEKLLAQHWNRKVEKRVMLFLENSSMYEPERTYSLDDLIKYCKLPETKSKRSNLSTVMWAMVDHKRVERTGEKGHYRYRIDHKGWQVKV